MGNLFKPDTRPIKQLFGDASGPETGATATSLVYRHNQNDDYVNLQVNISAAETIIPSIDGSGDHSNAVPIPDESYTASGAYSVYMKSGQTLSLDLTGNTGNVTAFIHY